MKFNRIKLSCLTLIGGILFLLNSCEKETINESQNINENQISKKAPSKVDVCHFEESENIWDVININENALESHLNHGDVLLIDDDEDGYVLAIGAPFNDGNGDNAMEKFILMVDVGIETITLPFTAGTLALKVDWGDGTGEVKVVGVGDPDKSHSYTVAGEYDITIRGVGTFFETSGTVFGTKIKEIKQWGNIRSTRLSFNDSFTMIITATDVPNLSGISATDRMFESCDGISTVPYMRKWKVAGVTNMKQMFNGCNLFNENISTWDVSNVTNMLKMFDSANAFNQPIGSWDVGSVTNMERMFYDAFAFNKDIGSWNMTGVTTIARMFRNAQAFNQSLNSWDVSGCTSFIELFELASAFNGNITNWDVSNVTTFSQCFNSASAFNQDIGSWTITSATNLSAMFANASSFNQDISSWDLTGVTNCNQMFKGAVVFSQDLSGWDVFTVTNMNQMFRGTAVNFSFANWDIRNVTDMANFLLGVTEFSQENWDASLNGWNTLVDPPSNITITSPVTHSAASQAAFDSLQGTWGWTIND